MQEGLSAALAAGMSLLRKGKAAIDAVQEAVRILEDCETFNAGRGSVLTAKGTVETDAAIMRGSDRRAGACACVEGVRNPIALARAVLDRTPHVLLVGDGALRLARQAGLRFEADDYFITEARKHELERVQSGVPERRDEQSAGTVGAVARDAAGHLAAATSTGGIVNQLPGRVGDSPVLGAGTWADDETCAVSATGPGEIILRCALAANIAARLKFGRQTLPPACQEANAEALALGGRVGCIAIDARGAVHVAFNTPGMARGWVVGEGEPVVALFADE
jgi:isoaspartyl peptidase/L-asparaginase-like protein (Ntn-hydrolase superfamily)